MAGQTRMDVRPALIGLVGTVTAALIGLAGVLIARSSGGGGEAAPPPTEVAVEAPATVVRPEPSGASSEPMASVADQSEGDGPTTIAAAGSDDETEPVDDRWPSEETVLVQGSNAETFFRDLAVVTMEHDDPLDPVVQVVEVRSLVSPYCGRFEELTVGSVMAVPMGVGYVGVVRDVGTVVTVDFLEGSADTGNSSASTACAIDAALPGGGVGVEVDEVERTSGAWPSEEVVFVHGSRAETFFDDLAVVAMEHDDPLDPVVQVVEVRSVVSPYCGRFEELTVGSVLAVPMGVGYVGVVRDVGTLVTVDFHEAPSGTQGLRAGQPCV